VSISIDNKCLSYTDFQCSESNYDDTTSTTLKQEMEDKATVEFFATLYPYFDKMLEENDLKDESTETKAQVIIEKVKKNKKIPKCKQLKLSNKSFLSIPTAIDLYSNLTAIDFRHNNLSTLPNSLSSLSQLKHIYLNHNNFTEVPQCIFLMRSLETLHLAYNKIDCFSLSSHSLYSLKNLALSNNFLQSLPADFNSLIFLEKLFLNNNKFTKVPDVLKEMKNLKHLVVAGNPLTDTSIESYSTVKELEKVLDFSLPKFEIMQVKRMIDEHTYTSKSPRKRAVIFISTNDDNGAFLRVSLCATKIFLYLNYEIELFFVSDLQQYRSTVSYIHKTIEEGKPKVSHLTILSHGKPNKLNFGLSVETIQPEDVNFVTKNIQLVSCYSFGLAQKISEFAKDVSVLCALGSVGYGICSPSTLPCDFRSVCNITNPRYQKECDSCYMFVCGQTKTPGYNITPVLINGCISGGYVSQQVSLVRFVVSYETHSGLKKPSSSHLPLCKDITKHSLGSDLDYEEAYLKNEYEELFQLS
jgi:hypothetical protein